MYRTGGGPTKQTHRQVKSSKGLIKLNGQYTNRQSEVSKSASTRDDQKTGDKH